MSEWEVIRLKHGKPNTITGHKSLASAERAFECEVEYLADNFKPSITGVELRRENGEMVQAWYKDRAHTPQGLVRRLPEIRVAKTLTVVDLEPGELFERDCKKPAAVYMAVDGLSKDTVQIVDLTFGRIVSRMRFGLDTPVRRLTVVKQLEVAPTKELP